MHLDLNQILVEQSFDLNKIKNHLNIEDNQLNELLLDFLKPKDKLIIKDLSFFPTPKQQILFNINFELIPNSFHVFIGENGAGKSTTIQCIIGIITKYKGNIYFDSNKQINRDQIFYVPAHQQTLPYNMSIKQYLFNLTKLLTNKNNKLINQEIEYWLTRYSLENKTNHPVNKLSSGQKQKLLIISAFLSDANFIILDEPFSNLDPTSRYLFMSDLKSLSNKNKTIFLSTHILDEIKQYATHATFIKKGHIILNTEVSNPDFIVNYYTSEYIKA